MRTEWEAGAIRTLRHDSLYVAVKHNSATVVDTIAESCTRISEVSGHGVRRNLESENQVHHWHHNTETQQHECSANEEWIDIQPVGDSARYPENPCVVAGSVKAFTGERDVEFHETCLPA